MMVRNLIIISVSMAFTSISFAEKLVDQKDLINSSVETRHSKIHPTSWGQLENVETTESPGLLVISVGSLIGFEVSDTSTVKYQNIDALKLMIHVKSWQDALAAKMPDKKLSEIHADGSVEVKSGGVTGSEKIDCTYTRGLGVKIINTDRLIECQSKSSAPSFDPLYFSVRFINTGGAESQGAN